VAKAGDKVQTGDIIGTVQETIVVQQKIMVPYGISGTIEEIKGGSFTVEETVCVVKKDNGDTVNLTMMQKWPVRKGRPYKEKLVPERPLVTGQRVIDTLFPIAKGGVAAVPGPFGSGKLMEFPELKDPRTGESLMKRTVLIANTSDMPVAAREASIYTGITIAEYFRDMGYSVALMADSTSRWAEALREMSGRLEEMPGEEGYPAYLASRLAQFYERAGRVISLGSVGREGTLSAIGAVSPPGGDISEPVSQATLRIVKVFWALDAQLAYRRHFPAINWLSSYSLYVDRLSQWFDDNVAKNWSEMRSETMKLLQEESELNEIVQLVGVDSLSVVDRLKLEATRSIREDYLHQNAFHEVDTYTSLDKQHKLLTLILKYYNDGIQALNEGADFKALSELPVKEKIGRYKYIEEKDIKEAFEDVKKQIETEISALVASKEVE